MPFPRGLLRNKFLVTCARKSGRLGPSGRIQSVQNSCYEKGTMGPARNRSLCPRTGKNNHVKDREDGRKDGQWTVRLPLVVQTVSWSQTLVIRFAFVLLCPCRSFFLTRVPATARLEIFRGWKTVSADYHWENARSYVVCKRISFFLIRTAYTKKPYILRNYFMR